MIQLIEKGIDINEKAQNGSTPLHYAASEGDLELIKILLDAGAEINISNNLGNNALFNAVNNEHYEIAKFLINNGAEINLISNELIYFDASNVVIKELECTILDILEKNYETSGRSYHSRKALKDFIEFFKEVGGKSINDQAN